MSADVDQEIYDDCTSLSTPKPPVMAKPVKDIAAIFGGKVGSTNAPSQRNSVSGPKKPVALVNPSKNNPGPAIAKSKPVVKPPAKPIANGKANAHNNNNNNKPENKRPVSGRISIPGPFNNPDDSASTKLNDFRNSLKPVGGINSNKDTNSSALKTLPTTNSTKSSATILTTSPVNNKTTNPSSKVTPPKSTDSLKTSPTSPKDSNIVLSCDNVKFRLKTKQRLFIKAPKKPENLGDVDFSDVIAAIPPAVPRRPPPKSTLFDNDDINNPEPKKRAVSIIAEYHSEDEDRDVSGGQYDDFNSAPPVVPARTILPKHSPSTRSPNSSASMKSPGSTSISTTSEGDTYDDCHVEGEMDDVYEDVEEVQKNAAKKEEEKRKEQERKEKKDREKREKDEKDKQRKLEKEKKKEKEMLAKYKMTGNEVTVTEGKVKENAKGNKQDLALKKGDNVYIIRLNDNPQFRWLAKTADGRVGYAESSNIEVMNQNIKNASLRDASSGEFEEVYDDVEALDADQDIYEETA